MQVDRIVSVFLAQPLLTAGLFRIEPGIPILMYHSVSDDPEVGVSPYYRLTTSPARFREQMRWLHKRGYAVIDLLEAQRRLSTGMLESERAVVLTFDDGFRDFATEAWPLLADFGFSATVFLPTGFIGRTQQSFKGRACLTWPDVRLLNRRGVRFGAHTVTHPVLYELSWADIRRELRDSRRQLEDELGDTVSTFAYPYAFPQEDGPFVDRMRQELHSQGYVAAVTTALGTARRGSDALWLRRLPVNETDDPFLFAAKLLGAYDWVAPLQAFARRARTLARET
ncbi:MAG: polysaccharide deacetylase family protein [Luteitalea sp.]|nr:polysaccharide deacetylase family protein [Luteitalea sp.]